MHVKPHKEGGEDPAHPGGKLGGIKRQVRLSGARNRGAGDKGAKTSSWADVSIARKKIENLVARNNIVSQGLGAGGPSEEPTCGREGLAAQGISLTPRRG